MASINTIVKRKQYLWLGIVVVGTASAIGGALYLSDVDMSGNGETVAEQEPVPDMTGVVDTTFDDKVRQHATTEMQVTAAQMQKQYEEIRRELDVLNKQRGDDQRRIEKLGQDNAALAEQVKALGANPVTATGEPVPQMPASPPGPEGEPQPGNTPVSFPPQGSVAVPPPTAFYPGNGVTPPPQVSVLKGYVFALMWLQSWPMLYAILNSAMTFYAKQNGAPVVLSEISQIQLKYSDLASTAGYLSMMIPPLSWMMVRGLGAGFSSVYSHFASSAISPTASAAGSVVDGNYSYGNMQTENVNGFSWSTNSTTSFGQMMYQTGSGATATQTRDGNMVMDASGAMSRLPVGINATRQIAAAQQEMAREASNRAESALHGFSSSIASAWNSLSQFGSNRGSSDSVTGGADSTMSAQDSMMASRMRSAVESYAKAHNISNEQATRELASRSTRGSAGMYGDAHAEWGVKPKILGVGGGVGVRGGGRASIDWSDEDAHQASSGSRASHDARHDIDARATQDFKEASDYFTSRKVSESGSHTDNNADSRVDQLSAALNSAKQSYDQYTTNMTRSHEYAEMASRTESMSGQMSEDLSQQFAQYVMKHAPQDAEAILTNTSSPEIAERRRAMAWSFVQEQVQPGVDNTWRESRGDIGKGMESVPSGGGSQDIIADHQGHQAIIEQRTQDSNIRNDVKHQVDNMVTEYRGNIGDTQSSIRGEENIVGRQYSELQNHHKTEALSQNNKYNEEKSGQERMPGADSPQELMKRAKEYQDKHKQ